MFCMFLKRFCLSVLPLSLAAVWCLTALAQTNSVSAVVLTIDGPIGPATSDYVVQGLDAAQRQDAGLVLLQLDTPGGLDTAMREIIKAILASPVPVVAYVSPPGARAASAGTYILYAAHVSAMAPATNLGAATPVNLGGSKPSAPEPIQSDNPDVDNESSKRRKMVNDAVAYIRGLAERRARNADWAEQAVRSGTSIGAQEAVDRNVVDLIADDSSQLLAAINNREIKTSAGIVTLNTTGMALQNRSPDWRMQLLAIITHPTVAYILLMIGIYGLILEGYSPGALVPGIVGAISLLTALFAFQVIPVNFAGLGLLALGLILMVAEAFAPSFGVLGLGGVAAFAFGSIMLMDTGVPGYGAPLAVIAAVAISGALLMFLIVALFLRSRKQPITTGREGLIGSHAEAMEDFGQRGWVLAHGERWQAISAVPVTAGAQLRITAVDSLTLTVEPTTRPFAGTATRS